MATIAKGMITLSSVNDAYSVSLSPSSCVINAKWNGDSPDYSNAKAQLTVYRGDTAVPFEITETIVTNVEAYECEWKVDESYAIAISQITEGKLSGQLKFHIKSGTDFDTWTTLPITVVRETSMLDWIVDWEQNKKTTLTGDYILTPKLYAGSISDGKLTGTYIGPSFDKEGHTGVYGYKDHKEIFHLDDTGGMIGGWTIDEYGIRSGKLQLLSSGSIRAVNDSGVTVWSINADGSAFFGVNEGITLNGTNGNATFKGQIEAERGKIGGWYIGEDVLQSGGVVLDSDYQMIGVLNQHTYNYTSGGQFVRDVALKGGVYMLYSDTNDYGLVGYSLDMKRVFRLGSENQIAGWHFNNDSLWSGEDADGVFARVNTEGAYTTIPGAITIGSNGMRGNSWYIDKDGSASFAKGLVKLTGTTSTISGWTLDTNCLRTTHVAVVSSGYEGGIYLSPANLGENVNSFNNIVSNNGGIFLKTDGANTQISGYSKIDGASKRVFLLNSNGSCQLGNWYFTEKSLYIGSQKDEAKSFTGASGSITLGSTGIRGFKWRLEADGSGALANGNISWGTDGSGSVAQGKIAWTADGSITLDASVKIAWTSVTGTEGVTNKLTKIDANGIYTGTISADNITTGTISTADIKNSSGTWYLNQNGSGALANGAVSWTSNGVMTINQAILNNVKINGTIRQPWSKSGIYISLGSDSMSFDNIAAGESGGWGDGSIGSMITWNLSDSGRIIRIANWKWGSQTFDGWVDVSAPSGKYFFEDGIAKSKLSMSREVVEMIGYGDSSTFYGWVVLNRVDFNTTKRYGRKLKCLAMGISTENGTNTPTLNYTTFDGKALSVSRIDTGKYKLTLPSEWGLAADKYQVMLTGIGSGLMKATLASRSATECEIHVSDDSSRNNGSFQFQIFNLNDWTLMRKDIEIHINTGDITLSSKNKVALRDFQWVDRPSNMEQRYLYGEVSVPGYVNESAIIQQGLYVEIPYTPIYKEIKLRIKRCFSDTEYQYVVNPKDGSNWFVVKASIGGAPIDNVFAPQLISISEYKFYLTFEGKEIRLYSGNESDMSVIKANWQNRNLMLKCVPGNNFRYPLTGVGLIRWTNSNISVTTLAQTLKEQFASDGTPVQSAQYDFDKKMLYMKLDTSKVDDDGNI